MSLCCLHTVRQYVRTVTSTWPAGSVTVQVASQYITFYSSSNTQINQSQQTHVSNTRIGYRLQTTRGFNSRRYSTWGVARARNMAALRSYPPVCTPLANWELLKWYDMIYLLTAIGLPPGGSSTVHIYTQIIHRTIQNKQYIQQHNNFGRVRAAPSLG
jgi:hypothetical protein